MPLYEFTCPLCGYRYELLRLDVMTADPRPPVPKCPNCNKPLVRMVSQSSFQLKGDGWTGKGE
jgi:putative FmdB family regulatory protein